MRAPSTLTLSSLAQQSYPHYPSWFSRSMPGFALFCFTTYPPNKSRYYKHHALRVAAVYENGMGAGISIAGMENEHIKLREALPK